MARRGLALHPAWGSRVGLCSLLLLVGLPAAMGYSVETSTDSAWLTLGYALAYNLGALLGTALSWGHGHRWGFWLRMLYPREACGERGAFLKPWRSVRKIVREVWLMPESELVRVCGVDSAVFVRMFHLNLQLYLTLALTLFPLLCTFYALGANPDGVTGINQLSLSNVLDKSTVMWVTLACLYFHTFLIFFLIWRHTGHVAQLRRRFFADKKRNTEPHNYATFVMGIPKPKDTEHLEARALPMTLRDVWSALKDAWGLVLFIFPPLGNLVGRPDQDSLKPRRKGKEPSAGEIAEGTASLLRPNGPPSPDGAADSSAGAAASDEGLPTSSPAELAKEDSALRDATLNGLSNGTSETQSLGSGAATQDGGPSTSTAGVANAQGADGSAGAGVALPEAAQEQGEEDEKPPSAGSLAHAKTLQVAAQWSQYSQPREPQVAPHVVQFFKKLYGDSVLHLQPVYPLHMVAAAHRRWRHALRKLNEARMQWEREVLDAEEERRRALGEDDEQADPNPDADSDSAQGKEKKKASKKRTPWKWGKRGAGLKKRGGGTSEAEVEPEALVKGKLAPLETSSLMPRHKINKKYGLWGGEEVESIPYWINEVKAAAEELLAAQEEARQSPFSSVVIAIFKSRVSAALCRGSLSNRGHEDWYGMEAAPVQEIWWDNLRYSSSRRRARRYYATFWTIIMVVFFYIPVTLIASLASGKALGTALAGQKEAVENTWLPPMLQSIVPSLALHTVLWIFSPVFMLIARWEGRTSLGDAMLVSSSRFYYVVFINVQIAYCLTSSLFTEIANLVQGEIGIVKLFATSIPTQAAFFIQYTLNSSLMCGMELGRLPIHICCFIVKRFLFGTQNCDRERHWDQGPMAYHVFIGYSNLVLSFGIVYAVIAPLILPFSLLYCTIAYFTWKHEVMHVYKDPVDKGGVYWLRLMHHELNALLLGQVTAVGMLGLKTAYTQMGIAFAIIPITILFRIWLNAHFGEFFRTEPLELMAEFSKEDDNAVLLRDPTAFASYFYPYYMKPPVLPSLDPLAPSDPNIWHYMHPERCLFVTENYFPTRLPPALLKEEGVEPPLPENELEAAYWKLIQCE